MPRTGRRRKRTAARPTGTATGPRTNMRTSMDTSTGQAAATAIDERCPPPSPQFMPRVLPARRPVAAASLLQLMWLASPALPVGGFSYSEGLEAAVEAGHVGDEASAGRWLADQLQLGLARSELPLVHKAIGAWVREDFAAVRALNDWTTRTRETSELRQQTQQMGRSMLEWLKNRGSTEERLAVLAGLTPAPTWPVAFALAAAGTGAPPRESLLAFAFGWAENMVQAALKAVPLGQNAGQRILGRLVDDIPAAVDHAMRLPDSQRQAFSPMLAVLSAQHESQYSRLFRS
jgi:urease accessory protein